MSNMKKLLLYTVALTMLLCQCGSGMIGLIEEEKIIAISDNHMSMEYTLDNGCKYFIIVIDYIEIEPGKVVYSELIVWKLCPGWDDGELLSDGYTELVETSLHEKYIEYVSGE